MNATKFAVLLIFVGVLCANLEARQLEGVSKETKLGITIPNTATTNGLGAELSSVISYTTASNSEYSDASAAAGPGGPNADGSGSVYKSTYGYVSAEGPSASTSSGSSASGSTTAGAGAGPNGAGGAGTASGSASSGASGSASSGAGGDTRT